MKRIIILIYVFFGFSAAAQNVPCFYPNTIPKIAKNNTDYFQNPFVGGLYSPVFSNIDLNNDGRLDILIFETEDGKFLTFINTGGNGINHYQYRPQYESFFPDSLIQTAFLIDYNKDKKPDIVCYSVYNCGGMDIYKNVSKGNKIEFEFLEKNNPLKTAYFSDTSSIFLGGYDIPSFVDVDFDGDLDILTFNLIGGYIDYHKNLSQEQYGHSDSLVFKLCDDRWARFMEGETSNEIFLHTKPGFYRFNKKQKKGKRHFGSTLLALDIDGDKDIDMLMGDTEYDQIVLLENGKTDFNYHLDSAKSVEMFFPSNTKPIKIKTMPGLYHLDINNDGVKDLVAAPREGFPMIHENKNQVWSYINKGTNEKSEFVFKSKDFIQEEILDFGGKTSPAFFDYDNDGDEDLFLATSGSYIETHDSADYIVLFENKGTPTKAVFQIKDNDFLKFRANKDKIYGIKITFEDIDGDGKKDMLMGSQNGQLRYYKNNISAGNLDFSLITKNFDNIDVGEYSAPFLVDMDRDGLLDLLIGAKFGNINYFKNIGTKNSPKFSLIADKLGKVSGDWYNMKMYLNVCDINNDNKLDLITGNENGDLHFLFDVENHLNDSFIFTDSILWDYGKNKMTKKYLGKDLHPTFAYLDGDNKIDLLLGNRRGGLIFYGTVDSLEKLGIKNRNNSQECLKFDIYPNPTKGKVRIKNKGTKDLIGINLNVFDVLGQKIVSKTFDNFYQEGILNIDISNYPVGVYNITLIQNGEILDNKTLIKK